MLRNSLRRRMYRGRRAGALAKIIDRATSRLAAAGVGPEWFVAIEVRGRRTGRTIRFPAVVAEYEGGRYVVSMLGEGTNWVRNVRASGGAAVIRHGGCERVRFEDVPVDRRAPILRCYVQRAPGARPHIPVDRHAPVEAFDAIAADYPVFLVTAQPESEQ